MALSLVRSSYSGILRDNMDFSTGIADRFGEMVAQGLSLPLQFGPMPDAIAAVCKRWGKNMNKGDVFILNDPFEGGTHLPDVFFIKPLFAHHKIYGARVHKGDREISWRGHFDYDNRSNKNKAHIHVAEGEYAWTDRWQSEIEFFMRDKYENNLISNSSATSFKYAWWVLDFTSSGILPVLIISFS